MKTYKGNLRMIYIKIITILATILLSITTTAKSTIGLYKITIRHGSLILFSGVKECYYTHNQKGFTFGSITKSAYHIKVEVIE